MSQTINYTFDSFVDKIIDVLDFSNKTYIKSLINQKLFDSSKYNIINNQNLLNSLIDADIQLSSFKNKYSSFFNNKDLNQSWNNLLINFFKLQAFSVIKEISNDNCSSKINELVNIINTKTNLINSINQNKIQNTSKNIPTTPPVQPTIDTQPVQPSIDNPPVQPTIDTQPVQDTIVTPPVQDTIVTPPVQDTIVTPPVQPTIDTQPVQDTIDTQPVQDTIDKPPVQDTIVTPPVQDTIDTQPVQPTIDTQPVQPTIDNPPVQETIDSLSDEFGNLNLFNDTNLKLSQNVNDNANIAKDILNKQNTQNIFNTLIQNGGDKKYIHKYLEQLNDVYKIYNSDIILQILGILSDKEIFDRLYADIYNNDMKNKFINLFFMSVNEYKNIIEILNIKNKIKRDSEIYNKYNKDNKIEVVLVYTVLKEILKENIDAFLINENNTIEFVNFLYNSLNKINLIKEQLNNLNTQKFNINKYYEEYYEKNKRIYTIIKERNDTYPSRNPRYNILEKDNYLLMKYNNFDGKWNEENKKNNKEEYYYFGKYDNIFLGSKMSNKEIAKKTFTNDNTKVLSILDKIIEKEQDICVIGYGQSGSGKTSTLIYFDVLQQDGILLELCKIQKFIDTFETIDLQLTNLYTYHGISINKMEDYDNEYSMEQNIKIDNQDKIVFKYNDEMKLWVYNNDSKKNLGAYINNSFDDKSIRQVEPTSNNPNSSRSHMIICLTLNRKDNKEARKIIVCDLAGVENVFQCDNKEVITKFDNAYKISKHYNKEKNKNHIIYDKYFCEQKNDKEFIKNDDLINKYNDGVNLTNMYREKLISLNKSHKKHVKILNRLTKTIKKGGYINTSCKEINDFKLCAKEFKFVNIHNGDINIIKQNIDLIIKKINNSNNILKNIILLQKYKDYSDDNFKLISKKYEQDFSFKNLLDSLHSNNNKYARQFYKVQDEILKNLIKRYDIEIKNFKNYISELNEWYCEHIRYDKIKHNCNIRKIEGFMINKTLFDLQDDIKMLMKSVLSKNNYLPLFYDKNIFPYCRNTFIDNNSYDTFYNNPNSNSLSGVLLNIIKNTYNVNFNKINFIIFTVVNFTNNGYVNNPPTPPYININHLKYLVNVKYNNRLLYNDPAPIIKEIISEINNLKNTIAKYSFYKNNNMINKFLNFNISSLKNNDIILISKNLINNINNNNRSTLIGSLETTDMLSSFVYDIVSCSYNVNLDYIFNKYKNFNLSQTINNNDISTFNNSLQDGGSPYYFNKYLKYLYKYYNLKYSI